MKENRMRPDSASACAMRYEPGSQTVPGGGALSLPAWEIYGGEAIRPAGELGFRLDRGCYLVQFSCQTMAAGAAVAVNGARLAYLEAEAAPQRRRLSLQGLVALTAPATLTVVNNAAASGFYSGAVLTVLQI